MFIIIKETLRGFQHAQHLKHALLLLLTISRQDQSSHVSRWDFSNCHQKQCDNRREALPGLERWNFSQKKKPRRWRKRRKKRDEITLWNLHGHLLICTPLCKNAGGANVSCLLWKGEPALSVTRDKLVQCAVSGVILSYGNAVWLETAYALGSLGFHLCNTMGVSELAWSTQSLHYRGAPLLCCLYWCYVIHTQFDNYNQCYKRTFPGYKKI